MRERGASDSALSNPITGPKWACHEVGVACNTLVYVLYTFMFNSLDDLFTSDIP